jgi:hypothetical protein
MLVSIQALMRKACERRSNIDPDRRLAGKHCRGHCGKVNRRHRHLGAVREQPGELLQRGLDRHRRGEIVSVLLLIISLTRPCVSCDLCPYRTTTVTVIGCGPFEGIGFDGSWGNSMVYLNMSVPAVDPALYQIRSPV